MPAPCNAKPISLGSTPWNEIRPKKCPSPSIPVVQLWQNPCNQSYPIPLGLTLSKIQQRGAPLNRVPLGCSTGVECEAYSSRVHPACLACPVAPGDGTGVGQDDRAGVESGYSSRAKHIPPGFTPWNQNSYLKHPSFECQFTQSRHNLCDRLNAIPLGTGKHIKKLKKSSAHSQS